jgi:small subunit ribosomal protein S28e
MDGGGVIIGTITDVLGKTGSRGGVSQCRVEVTQNGKLRQITRNVIGPVKKGDKISLLEAEREARRMR